MFLDWLRTSCAVSMATWHRTSEQRIYGLTLNNVLTTGQ